MGAGEVDLALGCVNLQAEAGLEEEKDRSGCPRLRRTGHGVEDRTLPRVLWEPAKQLRHTVEVEVQAGLEQPRPYLHSLLYQAVASQALRNQGVVVRSDGASMVAHRVVAAFRGGDRVNAPAREQRRRQERLCYLLGMLGARDASKEALPGVGGLDPAGPLVAVQSQGIRRQLLAPECLLEPLQEFFGGSVTRTMLRDSPVPLFLCH